MLCVRIFLLIVIQCCSMHLYASEPLDESVLFYEQLLKKSRDDLQRLFEKNPYLLSNWMVSSGSSRQTVLEFAVLSRQLPQIIELLNLGIPEEDLAAKLLKLHLDRISGEGKKLVITKKNCASHLRMRQRMGFDSGLPHENN